MGECSSRPNYVDIAAHINYRNTVNDAYFIEARVMPGEKRDGMLAKIRSGDKKAAKTAKEYLDSLQGQIDRATTRLQKITGKTEAKMILEIRKGMDLYPLGFPKVKGLVCEIVIPAIDRKIRTSMSDPYIPKWFHLAYIAYEQDHCPEQAELTVYSVAPDNDEVPLATCPLDLRESIDTTQVRWHMLRFDPIYEAPDVIPQIEIRYWNLRSMEAFWSNIISIAQEELDKVKAAMDKQVTQS